MSTSSNCTVVGTVGGKFLATDSAVIAGNWGGSVGVIGGFTGCPSGFGAVGDGLISRAIQAASFSGMVGEAAVG
jgi:hypothetical protein